jgi:hypothetical protein
VTLLGEVGRPIQFVRDNIDWTWRLVPGYGSIHQVDSARPGVLLLSLEDGGEARVDGGDPGDEGVCEYDPGEWAYPEECSG